MAAAAILNSSDPAHPLDRIDPFRQAVPAILWNAALLRRFGGLDRGPACESGNTPCTLHTSHVA